MKKFQTEQEDFWAGEFGDDYIARNEGQKYFASNVAFFAKILTKTDGIESVIEYGANIGLNLLALKTLLPGVELSAIEINAKAVQELNKIEKTHVYHDSILNFEPRQKHDFVLVKGVLIHINPNRLPEVYDKLYESSGRFICIAEYYNPTPVELSYRAHKDKLFKRDFTGEMLDRFDDLRLVDYGFAYHNDNNFKQDDITWFLLERR